MKKITHCMPLLMVLCVSLASPALANRSQVRNGLPPTRMDSFVLQAKENAEFIYGDEGTTDIPPYFGFVQASRINAGIMDRRDQGLTTGHGSIMPDATGRDEFLGQEWSQSGARGRSEALGFQDGMPDLIAPFTPSHTDHDYPFDTKFTDDQDDPDLHKR